MHWNAMRYITLPEGCLGSSGTQPGLAWPCLSFVVVRCREKCVVGLGEQVGVLRTLSNDLFDGTQSHHRRHTHHVLVYTYERLP